MALGPGVGSLRWACTFHIFCADFICVGHPSQTRFFVEYGLKMYLKTLTFALAPTPTPDASQGNIGGVGSLALAMYIS